MATLRNLLDALEKKTKADPYIWKASTNLTDASEEAVSFTAVVKGCTFTLDKTSLDYGGPSPMNNDESQFREGNGPAELFKHIARVQGFPKPGNTEIAIVKAIQCLNADDEDES